MAETWPRSSPAGRWPRARPPNFLPPWQGPSNHSFTNSTSIATEAYGENGNDTLHGGGIDYSPLHLLQPCQSILRRGVRLEVVVNLLQDSAG